MASATLSGRLGLLAVPRAPDLGKAEREAMEKASLIYVRNVSANSASTQTRDINNSAPELGLGLATGTRLRARLESAASTAVRTPVLAVIEYNYERDGEIVVPAGAKAVGHIRNGDRSGYVDIQFDSLLMPDRAVVPIEAAATDLDLRPLKGKLREEHGQERAGQIAVGNRASRRDVGGTRQSEPTAERVGLDAGACQQQRRRGGR